MNEQEARELKGMVYSITHDRYIECKMLGNGEWVVIMNSSSNSYYLWGRYDLIEWLTDRKQWRDGVGKEQAKKESVELVEGTETVMNRVRAVDILPKAKRESQAKARQRIRERMMGKRQEG